ncbi:REP-associated tyrosine transposase [Oceanisphaera profunda]|uniref:REP-associated tyrosine transposase n=1 Tax=Oceanisphaera profunda TaxID=1416627 RepID=UPI001D132402|nr:transposase [Oceanisphaera profunda]
MLEDGTDIGPHLKRSSTATISQFLGLAWVIMPDHLHWLMQLGESHDLSSTLQLCKGRSARAINLHLNRQGRLWQKGLNETTIRKDEDLRMVARYIVANPLRAQLVKKLGDYPLWDAVWL